MFRLGAIFLKHWGQSFCSNQNVRGMLSIKNLGKSEILCALVIITALVLSPTIFIKFTQLYCCLCKLVFTKRMNFFSLEFNFKQ